MRLFPALLCLALPLTLAPASVASVAASDPSAPPPHRSQSSDPHTWQTSDRVVGPDRPTTPAYGRPVTSLRQRFGFQASPSVHVASYQERIGARTVRYFVVAVNWRRRGIHFALAQPPHTDMVQRVRWMAEQTPHAVAGVNGDFFDIGRTGAPLGLGVSRGRVFHGINSGWNHAFYVDRRGLPHIGEEPMTAVAPAFPHLGLTNVNSPHVRLGGIGVYNTRWGTTAGRTWVAGDRRNVAMAHLIDHRVVGFAPVYRPGTRIVGEYLVARGEYAVRRLHRLRVGDRVRIRTTALHRPQMAVTGNAYLVQGGRIVATDDTELNPRTAVGIDRSMHRVYFIVVEGRQEFSDGFTMVELARKFKALHCDGALNLDGGGSSTLVARSSGAMRLLNSPSDGQQRPVANALVVTYTKPHHRHRRH